MKKKSNFTENFLLGGTSAAIAKTLTAPMERVKLILQTQDSNLNLIKNGKKYKGILDTFKRVTAEEGFYSLWRGNLINVMRYFPTQAMNFAFKEKYKIFFKPKSKNPSFLQQLYANLMAGGAAGVTSLTVTYPLDFARTRLSADVGKTQKEFKNFRDCMIKIKKADGYLGFYRGYGVSVIGNFMYRATYFGVYDTVNPYMPKSVVFKFFTAQAIVTFSSLFAFPMDTVRRRMMMQSGLRGEMMYAGGIDCFKKVIKSEGWAGLYKGALSNIFRGVGASLVLVLNDEFHVYLKKVRGGKK